jgi:hypothetical protein
MIDASPSLFDPPEWIGPNLSVTQAAERMDCSADTVRRLCRAGEVRWRAKAGAVGTKCIHMEIDGKSVDDWIIRRRHARFARQVPTS